MPNGLNTTVTPTVSGSGAAPDLPAYAQAVSRAGNDVNTHHSRFQVGTRPAYWTTFPPISMPLSLVHEVPLSEEMQGDCLVYLKSGCEHKGGRPSVRIYIYRWIDGKIDR